MVPQVTIKDVFDAVLSGSVTHGIVPIENSTNGSVTMTFDLFRDLKHGNLKVCGEEFVQVQHALLANCQLKEIERIYSHPQVDSWICYAGWRVPWLASAFCRFGKGTDGQAFGQCEMWLDRNLKGVERINVSSTSRAARMLKDDPKAASISNRICADIYHTKVIAESIQDTQSTIDPSLPIPSDYNTLPFSHLSPLHYLLTP